MIECEFLPDARREMEEAFADYEAEREGLGSELAIEVWRTISRIQELPNAWPQMAAGIRRCGTNRFPYGLIYHAGSDRIVLIAVAHLKRRPFYWRSRDVN